MYRIYCAVGRISGRFLLSGSGSGQNVERHQDFATGYYTVRVTGSERECDKIWLATNHLYVLTDIRTSIYYVRYSVQQQCESNY